MSAEPITFTGTLTEQDVVDMHRYRSRCIMRPFFRWLIGGISGLIVVIGIVLLVHGERSLELCVIVGLFAYGPTVWWYHDRFAVRRSYRKHSKTLLERTVVVTEQSVSVSDRDYDARLNWNLFAFLLDTPRGLLFMVKPMQLFCWLPERLFADNDYKAAILAYAKQNNVAVRPMN